MEQVFTSGPDFARIEKTLLEDVYAFPVSWYSQHIMKKCRSYGIRIKRHICKNMRNFKRMYDIWVACNTALILMRFTCKLVSTRYFIYICITIINCKYCDCVY